MLSKEQASILLERVEQNKTAAVARRLGGFLPFVQIVDNSQGITRCHAQAAKRGASLEDLMTLTATKLLKKYPKPKKDSRK